METVDEYGVLNPHAAANIPMQGSVNVSVLHMFQKLASTYLCIISVDEDSMIRKKWLRIGIAEMKIRPIKD